jgi:hypothetical protein
MADSLAVELSSASVGAISDTGVAADTPAPPIPMAITADVHMDPRESSGPGLVPEEAPTIPADTPAPLILMAITVDSDVHTDDPGEPSNPGLVPAEAPAVVTALTMPSESVPPTMASTVTGIQVQVAPGQLSQALTQNRKMIPSKSTTPR